MVIDGIMGTDFARSVFPRYTNWFWLTATNSEEKIGLNLGSMNPGYNRSTDNYFYH